MPIWRRLLAHSILLAASRTFWTAGSNRAINNAMMAMTTRSSISVNPVRFRRLTMTLSFQKRNEKKRIGHLESTRLRAELSNHQRFARRCTQIVQLEPRATAQFSRQKAGFSRYFSEGTRGD